jgi:hypothetical protein
MVNVSLYLQRLLLFHCFCRIISAGSVEKKNDFTKLISVYA